MTEQEELEQLLAYVQTPEFLAIVAALEKRHMAGEQMTRSELIAALGLEPWFAELWLEEVERRQRLGPKVSGAKN